jgi:hypothetical protein
VSGEEIPEESVTLAPNETRVWEGVYAPLTHSEVKDDVSVAVSFNEYVTGEFLLEEEKLTVVKLELLPLIQREGCLNRHLVGVRELVNCSAVPNIGTWYEVGDGEFRWNGTYCAPLVKDNSSLFYMVDENSYVFQIQIIEPSIIVARFPEVKSFDFKECIAGGVGMEFEVYILPESVSFSGISMEEIPSMEGVHTGYFANPFFKDIWYHTVECGAGIWFNLTPNNSWGNDEAVMGDELPFEQSNGTWSNGQIIWSIKWGWGERNNEIGDLPIKSLEDFYNQSFTIDHDGTLTIDKFGHSVSRGTNNVIRLNGIIIENNKIN